MGVLQIECYCSQEQMDAALSFIEKRLYAVPANDVEDVDEEIMDIRICVDYEVCLGKVSVLSAEILDGDWDILYEDTAVFSSRLKRIVNDYNLDAKQRLSHAQEIRRDQLTEIIFN